jgi:beta-lactamase superfamily II metal-dependent hydrolase
MMPHSLLARWPRVLTAILFLQCSGLIAAGSAASPPFAQTSLAVSDTGLRIHIIRVGQGDATLLVTASGGTMLIDAGPQSASNCAGANGIVTYLTSVGLTHLDYFVASHYDADHIGCADEVLARWPVRVAVIDRGPTAPPTTQTYQAFVAAAQAVRQTAVAGQVITLAGGTAELQVVAVNGNGRSLSASNQNDRGVVLRLRHGRFDALFGGDVSASIESDIATAVGKVEVYKVHHHGSRTSSSRSFLESLRPKVATLSLGSPNAPGHPDQDVLDSLRSVGAVTYWTSAGDDAPALAPHDVLVNAGFQLAVTEDGRSFRVEFQDDAESYSAWDETSTLSSQPSSLAFSARKAGVILTPNRLSARIEVNAAGAWTATSTAQWLQVTDGAGQGGGTESFEALIVNPSDIIGQHGSLSGAITLTSSVSSPSSISIPVTLSIAHDAVPAFGQVDTPIFGAGGVVGAIGVTGWALDNVGVTGVKIYRNCLSFENQASCQVVLGHNVVEVGDAAFLTGARPDLEAAFSTYPAANRAGWGYLMLTSMLPHVTNQQQYGGQGPLTLYAVATDVEGNKKLLGRSSDPASPEFATPTQITMANASIAKPFGAIDTPGQGETVSGTLNNFGWALTPDSNTTGGEGADILIPTNGSTMTVFIDSLPTALVAYNQCRGSVGNPVPTGIFCNDDVSNIFGNATPQPVLTTRTANATLFRNLDAGRAPIGVYSFNTATLANGLHTIAWSVSDSAGRNEGIGSRFFNVLNSGADVPVGGRTFRSGGSAGSEDPASETQMLADAPAQVLGQALSLATRTPVTSGVYGRTGFDLAASWQQMQANEDGRYTVRLPEMGRLELWLGDAVETGYLVANGTLRSLPTGSALRTEDATASSVYGWMPPVGYIGDYALSFVRDGERIDVTVTIVPTPGAVAEDVAQIRMNLDEVRTAECGVRSSEVRSAEVRSAGGRSAECSVRVDGWAFDPQASIGSGIGAVHVWARKLDLVGLKAGEVAGAQAPFFLGAATVGTPRPDVARAFTGTPQHTGFTLTTPLAVGTYELTAYVWNVRTARWEDARSQTVIVR